MARPKEFNREEVLDRAIATFWCRGYEATSVQDLLDEMGINRGSLYDTFGDKHTLFLAAIDRYYDRALAGTVASLEAPGPARVAIERTVRSMVECAGADVQRRGCLMTNSAVELAPRCAETAGRVARYYRDTEAAFERAVARARREGDVRSELDDLSIARFLTCSLQGLQVYAKVAQDRGALGDITAAILGVLG
jgi:TetR/AcrR family transcriptional repressor of nem operon